MVSVWAADITPLLIEETYQAYYDKVPEWRKDKADKLKNVDDKARSVGAWILWEKMKKVLRLTESEVFNLSHSGKYVLCACSDRGDVQTGCDVEMKGKLRWQNGIFAGKNVRSSAMGRMKKNRRSGFTASGY